MQGLVRVVAVRGGAVLPPACLSPPAPAPQLPSRSRRVDDARTPPQLQNGGLHHVTPYSARHFSTAGSPQGPPLYQCPCITRLVSYKRCKRCKSNSRELAVWRCPRQCRRRYRRPDINFLPGMLWNLEQKTAKCVELRVVPAVCFSASQPQQGSILGCFCRIRRHTVDPGVPYFLRDNR
jgi:hypothetical protein